MTEWDDPKIDDFAKSNRPEWRLEHALLEDGVPAKDLVVMKDREVTKQALHDALVAHAKGTPEGGRLPVDGR